MNAHLDELLVDALLDEDPGAVGADLALRQEVGHEGALHRVLQVGVLEDDERGLPAQLEGHVADAFRAGL